MVFDTGAKITADLIEQIASTFITSGLWHNVDYTWNITDKTANNARRTLAYGAAGEVGRGNTTLTTGVIIGNTTISVGDITNFNITDKIVIGSGATAEVRVVAAIGAGVLTLDYAVNTTHAIGETVKALTFQLYLAMEVINTQQNFYSGYYAKGFRFVISTGWNGTTHTNSGTIQSTLVNFETHTTTVPSDLATLKLTYWLWIEENGNGFVMMGKPEPSGSNAQGSFIIVLEKIANPANKEYVDSQTDFFLYTVGNVWGTLYDGYVDTMWRNRAVLRPFAYQYPDIISWRGGLNPNGGGISFSPLPAYYGYKSIGNGKVYYIKPIINNTPNQLSPIFQSELFFQWSEGLGLIDGDVVAVQGQPVKFLCKAIDSPDNTIRLTYAIKYFG